MRIIRESFFGKFDSFYFAVGGSFAPPTRTLSRAQAFTMAMVSAGTGMLAKYQKVRFAVASCSANSVDDLRGDFVTVASSCSTPTPRQWLRHLQRPPAKWERLSPPIPTPTLDLQIEKPVGEGTYGVVYKARDKVS